MDPIVVRIIHGKKALSPAFNEYATRYAINALKDPMNPTCCAGAIDFAIANIQESYYDSFPDELWASAYGFLIAKRTDEQMKSLLQRLGKCTCKQDGGGLHVAYAAERVEMAKKKKSKDPVPEGDGEVQIFIFIVAKLLHHILTTEKLNVVEITKGTAKKWPHKISDLLPGGGDQLVKSILQWHKFLHWNNTIMIVRNFMRIIPVCANLLHDSLIRYDAMNKLFINLLQQAMWSHLKVLEEKKIPDIASTAMFDMIITDFLEFLTEVCSHPTKSTALMNGNETKALQLCSITLYLMPTFMFQVESVRQHFLVRSEFVAEMGRLLFRFYRMYVFGRLEFLVHPQIVLMDSLQAMPKDMPPPLVTVARGITVGRADRLCAVPFCKQTFTHVANEFKMCNRCLAVGYCGRACQVHDWKDAEFPHKRVCPLICKIIEARGGWKAPIPEDIMRAHAPIIGDPLDKNEMMMHELPSLILKMITDGLIAPQDFAFLTKWAERTYNTKVLDRPSEKDTVWHPGFDEYNDVLSRIVNLPPKFAIPPPQYLDPNEPLKF